MEKTVNKKQIFSTVFWVIVLIGSVNAYLLHRHEAIKVVEYLRDIDLLTLSLLVPTIILMYYAAGRIWYPYLRHNGLSAGELARIQYELNFVNTVVPFLNVVAGLAYAVARLKKFGVSEAKAGGMYTFRYMISIFTKWIEIAIAIAIMIAMGEVSDMPRWTILLAIVLTFLLLAVCISVILAFVRGIQVPQGLYKLPVLGKSASGIQKTLDEAFEVLSIAFSGRSAIRSAFGWGMLYSLLEILPFWIVALALGHAELLLIIIVASGVAITLGVVIPTPMGIGGFEGAMILFMGATTGNVALVSIVALTGRILVLLGTSLTGIPFWLNGMKQIGRSTDDL